MLNIAGMPVSHGVFTLMVVIGYCIIVVIVAVILDRVVDKYEFDRNTLVWVPAAMWPFAFVGATVFAAFFLVKYIIRLIWKEE